MSQCLHPSKSAWTSSKRSTRASRVIAAIAAAFLLAGGCSKETARVEPPPPKVVVAHPETRSVVEYDEYNGWMEAPEVVEVRARVRGHIQKVFFTDGQLVKKGEVLFQLDPRPLQQDLDRSIEQVEIFQSQLGFALVEEKRMKQMREQGVGSPIELESAQAKARSLEAQVEAQKKEVERKKQELDYATIRAEIGGRIGRALMTEGNLVNAGGSDPLLATITKVNPMSIYFNVDERALQRYAKSRPTTTRPRDGQLKDLKINFQFGLETDEGFPHEATLDFADNKVNRETGTILARGETNNAGGQFVPGSRVRIRLPVGDAKDVLLVPDTAILTDQDRKYVLVLDDKNVVHRRDVDPGRLLDDGMRVITPPVKGDGLTANDWIVTQGLQMARINYPVEPIKPSTTQPAAANAGR